jgi:hypothetical protein
MQAIRRLEKVREKISSFSKSKRKRQENNATGFFSPFIHLRSLLSALPARDE